MGKGTRSRRISAEKRQQEQEQQQLDLKKAQKQRCIAWIVGAVALVAVFGLAVGLIVDTVVKDSGRTLRSQKALSSEHFTVTNAMMSYFISNYAAAFMDTYADDLAAMGLDRELPLKAQPYDDTSTWFTYFADAAVGYATEFLNMAEAARAAGYTLSEDGKKSIEDNIKNMHTYAQQAGMSPDAFTAATFGRGVKEEDVRAALELSVFAEEYTAVIRKELTCTDQQLADYYAAHRNRYQTVTVLRFSLSFAEDEVSPADAKALAEQLAATTTEEGFKQTLSAWLTDYYFPVCLEEKASEATVKHIVTNLSETIAYSETDAVSRWAFADGRKAGDTYITGDGSSQSTYMLLQTAQTDKTPSRNVCQFLFALEVHNTESEATKAANAMLDAFMADTLSVDAFDALADAQTEEGVEGSCLMRNCPKGLLPSALEEWLYDEERLAGDAGLVTTVYGVHLLYYVGEGIPQYLAELAETILTDRMEERLTQYAKTYPVTVNRNIIDTLHL